jgi:sugar phosphate permease
MPLGRALKALRARRSYLVNTAAQTLYTFSIGGLAHWMPTYFQRERGIPIAQASQLFGMLLLIAGFLGTVTGGQLGDRLARRSPGAHFSMSGAGLLASIPTTLVAVLAPQPLLFWPAMFVTLFLLFLNTAPLNAAMANVLPPELRGVGFGLYTACIHLLGDAASPTVIGTISDRVGLKAPVLGAGLLMGLAGLVLIAGRRTLARDLGTAAA